PLKLIQDWKNAPAGGDLLKLRDFAAQVSSKWLLNSRNLLWDWNPGYAPMARRGSYASWQGNSDSNLDKRLQRPLCYRYTIPLQQCALEILPVPARRPARSWRSGTNYTRASVRLRPQAEPGRRLCPKGLGV